MKTKKYLDISVLEAAEERISYAFDNFEKLCISFSGGKDSSVMFHLVMAEAVKRDRKVGVLIVDMEAQYKATIEHIEQMLDLYAKNVEPYWVCLPLKLRNAASNFEPVWTCWDNNPEVELVREYPTHKSVIKEEWFFPFFVKNMEFEEFIVLFADWYADGKTTGSLVGIRADESLNRYRTICAFEKQTFKSERWTTKISDHVYNLYPIYDWKTKDIWVYHAKNKEKPHNKIYDLMHQAGVPMSQQRLCQPYGDDQRRGLWLYHILEPETWYKVVSRVNGVNSASLYIHETGNIMGYNKISLPEGHTYQSFCKLLLATMPKVTQDHFMERFSAFIKGWRGRGYTNGIPDYAPSVLENKHWAPSWRRLCKVLLRNDWWCKGLGMQQPKSVAYGKYLKIREEKKNLKKESVSEENKVTEVIEDKSGLDFFTDE